MRLQCSADIVTSNLFFPQYLTEFTVQCSRLWFVYIKKSNVRSSRGLFPFFCSQLYIRYCNNMKLTEYPGSRVDSVLDY